jgi:sugar transferase EpsL
MQYRLKRAIDLAIAGPAILVLSPLIGVIAAAITLNMGRPILFRQLRPGKNGTPFGLLKFRSMSEERDKTGNLLPDERRVTRFGTFLRQTSLDELPQLWNVLRGELSVVGPRPLLMEYLTRYTPDQARRHQVLPGITGWAQVNGRNTLSWERKFELDVWYVDHWSLWLDFKILGRTISQVLLRKGISQRGHATMPVFRGTQNERESAQ